MLRDGHASGKSSRSRRAPASFKLQDLNKHWWEISNVTQSYYDAIFAKAH
jgi:hypothetical protein